MNTDLTSLPEHKRSDLQRIVVLVRERCTAVGMIILFGSYARGDWKELKDLAPDRKSGHPSDYDILVILPDEAECDSLARQEINQACAGAKLSATARFIYHEIDYVNRKLEIGQYFFSDIVAEGKMLYDADVFTLAEEKALTPDEHYLGLLGAHAAHIDNAFRTVFSCDDEFEREAFTALEYAYIGARYDKRYTIDERSVRYLAGRVEALIQLTEARCREKIATLQRATDS